MTTRRRPPAVFAILPSLLALGFIDVGRGVVVEDVKEGFAAHRALVAPGDILLGWERAAASPSGPDAARGEIDSPFDLEDVEREQAPRGELTLVGTRGGEPLAIRMGPGEWRLSTRPQLEGAVLKGHDEARRLLARGEDDQGLARWREAALGLRQAGDHERASGLWVGLGRAAADKQRWAAAEEAFGEAVREAKATGSASRVALSQRALGLFLEQRNEWDRAVAAYREASEAGSRERSASLGEAWTLSRLARVALSRGDLAGAEDHYRRALDMAVGLAPQSLDVAAALLGLGNVANVRGDLAGADHHYRRALAIRERLLPDSLDVASSLQGLAIVASKRGDLAAAEDHYGRALAIRERLVPGSLDVAAALQSLGLVAFQRGRLDVSEEYHQRALAIQQRLAPDSLAVALTLDAIGLVAQQRGDLPAAEDHYRRALALKETLGPRSQELSRGLHYLGSVAHERGDLAAAEDYYRRALAIEEAAAPGSPGVAATLNNLGLVAGKRGDPAAAEDYFRRSLAIKERLTPESADTAVSLNNLGGVAQERGDLTAAASYYQRALAIRERLAPQGLEVALSLYSLGDLAWNAGDAKAAEGYLRRTLAIQDELAPRSLVAASTLGLLGDLAQARGDLAGAEREYRRSLEIRRELAAGSAAEAEACRRLAAFHRRRQEPQQAVALYQCALDALDAQREKLGGAYEVRSGFASRYGSYYKEAIDLQMDMGQPEAAFHVLERYRARVFLSLLASRDLVFAADIPAELDRRRRLANAEYDRALAELARAKADQVEGKREALRAIRREQSAVQDRIRATSARLTALEYPEPVDLTAARKALDPGTLLLSYSIGRDVSHLFAVGPGPGDFAAVTLQTDPAALRRDVEQFRRLVQQESQLRRGALRMVARRLGTVLLGPVADQIARAERLLILPDGPLHLIPFAALADPAAGGRFRYLVEAKPVHVAASGTVYARLRQSRRPARQARLVAFGDPDYSAVPPAEPASGSPSGLRLARERGLDLRPLAGSRKEVLGLERLYPGSSLTYLGAKATEEAAKAVGADVSLLHFACHGVADETSPLDSSLALSMPGAPAAGHDNGLLQAWEVLEQVRIDADLVTLSACSTALGKEMSGEGILGLTRAFQHAGARSVLASLWAVKDDSTAELMRRFYGHLRTGLDKDRALRAAQLEMIRGPQGHPHRWAAFQLVGDCQ